MQLVGRITKHRQPAALLWPFQAEAADDSEAARLQGVQHLLDRALPLLSAGQEMEHCPVRPDVEGGSRQIGLQHIRSKPVHGFTCRAEMTPGGVQGSGRDVQHHEPCEAGGKQIVYQSRFVRPHVDDRPVQSRGSPTEVLQGRIQMGRAPAHRVRGLGLVDRFPVALGCPAGCPARQQSAEGLAGVSTCQKSNRPGPADVD